MQRASEGTKTHAESTRLHDFDVIGILARKRTAKCPLPAQISNMIDEDGGGILSKRACRRESEPKGGKVGGGGRTGKRIFRSATWRANKVRTLTVWERGISPSDAALGSAVRPRLFLVVPSGDV